MRITELIVNSGGNEVGYGSGISQDEIDLGIFEENWGF